MGIVNLFTSLALMSPGAYANNELESVEVYPSGSRELMLQNASIEQTRLAKEIPQTVILRVNKRDPKKIEVAFLKEKVSEGKVQKVKADFQKLVEDSELRGISYNSSNELEATSSTSSWGWRPGWGGGWGGWGGWGRWAGWRPGWGWGGGGWYRPPYWGGVAVGYPVYPSYATSYGYGCPNVYYYGYSYPYCPYAGWSSGGWVNVAFRW